METTIDIELFRFNHKTDYLPYYKKYTLQIDDQKTVQDLLGDVNNKESFNYSNTEKFGVKINNLFVTTHTKLEDIIEKTSSNFIIEPVSTYRAIHDLEIDNKDFFSKLQLLEEFLTKEQKEHYANTLQTVYYSSNSLNINKDYIGDHLLIIAYDLISEDSTLQTQILEKLKDKTCGLYYHTSLQNRLLFMDGTTQEKINTICSKVLQIDEADTAAKKLQTIAKEKIAQKFTDFNIAVYDMNQCDILKNMIDQSDANFIKTHSQENDIALHCLKTNEEFTFKLAGEILLEAKDNNADFLLVADETFLQIFDRNQQKIEKAVGREINLPIVTLDEFIQVLKADKEKKTIGFEAHKVKIEFI